MSKISGRLVDVAIGKEATRGVGVAPTVKLPFTTLSFEDKTDKVRSSAGLGVLANSEDSAVAVKYGGGELESQVRVDSIGLLLLSVIGSVSTATTTTGVYTHTFTVSNTSSAPSLSIVMDDTNSEEMYKFGVIDTLGITTSLDDYAMMTASFLSKTSVPSTATIPALSTSDTKFSKKDISIKIADSVAGLSAASALTIKALDMTISKSAVLDNGHGTAEPLDILATGLGVEGTITLNYESETYKNYMRNGNTKSMQITFENTDVVLSAGYYPKITIILPKVDFSEWEADYTLEDIVSQTITFTANHDVTNGIISTCEVVNGVASY